ncbi:hypothetical protein ES703_104833 [subsurface metagenome]
MHTEKTNTISKCEAALIRKSDVNESGKAHGRFIAECFDKNGKLKWRDTIENVVCTIGKNVALDTYLAGSGYTVTGPFMGLISSVDYGAGPVAADTMASHDGWKEAGATNAPTYTAPRKTCAWDAAAAGSKALSAALSFVFTGAGTVKGCFLVYFTGAVNTIDNTNGTLYSAGLFTGGDKTVADTDTLNITYTASL